MGVRPTGRPTKPARKGPTPPPGLAEGLEVAKRLAPRSAPSRATLTIRAVPRSSTGGPFERVDAPPAWSRLRRLEPSYEAPDGAGTIGPRVDTR